MKTLETIRKKYKPLKNRSDKYSKCLLPLLQGIARYYLLLISTWALKNCKNSSFSSNL